MWQHKILLISYMCLLFSMHTYSKVQWCINCFTVMHTSNNKYDPQTHNLSWCIALLSCTYFPLFIKAKTISDIILLFYLVPDCKRHVAVWYAVIELELLAIEWAVAKCHLFLAGMQHFSGYHKTIIFSPYWCILNQCRLVMYHCHMM